ncbi:hypothetical protein C0J52_21610 [Blattella germanica]|nr:hypothetical protein C0J52_21610 [Blattella germanica]
MATSDEDYSSSGSSYCPSSEYSSENDVVSIKYLTFKQQKYLGLGLCHITMLLGNFNYNLHAN